MIDGLKPYPVMKDSGVPWLGEVPGGWTVQRAKQHFREVDDRSVTGGEEMLSVSHKTGVTPRREKNVTMFLAESNVGHKVCRPDDIVVNTMWAWMAALGVSKNNGLVSPAYGVYRPKTAGSFLPRFLDELLRTPAYTAEYVVQSTGITASRLRLYPDRFLQIPILTPPLPDQHLIVRFLDHADRQIRVLIAAKQRMIKLLEEQKRAIIHQAVTRGLDPRVKLKPSGVSWLGDVPEHWKVTRLGRVIRLATGFPFASAGFSQDPVDVRLLRGVNISPGRVRWDAVVRWPVEQFNRHSEYALQIDDIVLGLDRPVIRAGVRVTTIRQDDIPSLLLQRVARIRPIGPLIGGFAYALLRGSGFIDHLAPIYTGVSVPHISPGQVGSFLFALPPAGEQARIVSFLDDETNGVDRVISTTLAEITLLREYRTRLISDVVTGKLDVREAAALLPAVADAAAPPPDDEDILDDLDEGAEVEPGEAEA